MNVEKNEVCAYSVILYWFEEAVKEPQPTYKLITNFNAYYSYYYNCCIFYVFCLEKKLEIR